MKQAIGYIRVSTEKQANEGVSLEAQEAKSITFRNMCATATLIAAAALERRESRGGHFRTDFPEPDPKLAHRSHMTLSVALGIRAACVEELA